MMVTKYGGSIGQCYRQSGFLPSHESGAAPFVLFERGEVSTDLGFSLLAGCHLSRSA
jgi:hypothetical protein